MNKLNLDVKLHNSLSHKVECIIDTNSNYEINFR